MSSVKDIAEKLNEIIEREREDAVRSHGKDWEEKYNWLVDDIRRILSEAELLRKDMVDNNLTIGAAESEGYLRCAIQMSKMVDYIESTYSDKDSNTE